MKRIPFEAGDCRVGIGILRLCATIRHADRLASLRMTVLGFVVGWFGLFSGAAGATTYYVSSSQGSDANSGTSSTAAWATIGHVNAQTFNPGDSVLFRRGDVWNEGLVAPSSGTAGNPITFDAYGSGPAPNLTGYYAMPASAWLHVTGNAWKALLPNTYTTVNFCLFGSVWGQKVPASTSNLTMQWDFYIANGYLYVYSAGNPGANSTLLPIVPMALSNVPLINTNGQSWLSFQHFLLNWFDDYGVYVQGASDHLVFANMEADSMIPEGTQPLGFYVNESAPGPGDVKIYNAEANLNYDGFRFDDAATAITMVNDKGYGNRDGALVDNLTYVSGSTTVDDTAAVTYSYCHFYASSLAVAGSTDVEWATGAAGPTEGIGNIPVDTAPAVQAWQRYPARVTLTVDDIGMTPNADTYYGLQVLPVARTAGLPVGVAITVGYASVMTPTVLSEIQAWIDAGVDVTAHSISHTYYVNTDALDIQYTGSGTAATMSIANNMLTITATGDSSSPWTYNLGQGQAQGTVEQLYAALHNTGKFTTGYLLPCEGPYGTGCSAYTNPALLSQDLADVSNVDVKSSEYHMLLDETKLTTDEITLSRYWMTQNLTGLPPTPVYVYPGGYEDPNMEAITAGVPYNGARGALHMGGTANNGQPIAGDKDTYASGLNLQDITSFGVNPSWMGSGGAGVTAPELNQKIQALVWKEQVWGAPWGVFWHNEELVQNDPVGGTEITNLIQGFKNAGATVMTNTELVNWVTSGTLATGTGTTDGNYYYKSPAASSYAQNGSLDFRPTANSPVVNAGVNLGSAYAIDINGVNQNSYGLGWEIGAHVYQGQSIYGGVHGMAGGHATVGTLQSLLLGPPTYLGSSQAVGFNPGVITPPFVSSAPTATTCSGNCQNSVGNDTTINPATVDAITRITDGSTIGSGASVDNNTCSGGSNDNNIGDDGTNTGLYYGPSAGGAIRIYHLNITGNPAHLTVVNNGGAPAISINCPAVIGHLPTTATTAYYLSGSQLYTETWNSTATALVSGPTLLVDYVASCPGIPSGFVAAGSSQMNASYNEDVFATALSAYPLQGTAMLLVSYQRSTNSCATTNLVTGQYYGYCVVSNASCQTESAAGTLSTGSDSCWGVPVWQGVVNVDSTGLNVTLANGTPWTANGGLGTAVGSAFINGASHYGISSVNQSAGTMVLSSAVPGAPLTGVPFYATVGIHNVQESGDGLMWVASFGANGGWTQGTCAGNTNSTQYSYVTIGSPTTAYLNGSSTYNYDSHQSIGISKSLSPQYTGPNVRANNNLLAWTQFFAPTSAFNLSDWHGTWLHYDGGDDLPWIFETDWAYTSAMSGCSTSAVYCPSYLNNVVGAFLTPWIAYFPGTGVAVFFHTYSCGANPNAVCTSGPDNTFGGQYTIVSAAPSGRFACFASSMLATLGNDKTGAPRVDAFCGMLQ